MHACIFLFACQKTRGVASGALYVAPALAGQVRYRRSVSSAGGVCSGCGARSPTRTRHTDGPKKFLPCRHDCMSSCRGVVIVVASISYLILSSERDHARLARARHPRPGAVRGPLGVSGPIYLGANDIYQQKPERTLKLNFRLNFTHKWNLGVGGSQEVMS